MKTAPTAARPEDAPQTGCRRVLARVEPAQAGQSPAQPSMKGPATVEQVQLAAESARPAEPVPSHEAARRQTGQAHPPGRPAAPRLASHGPREKEPLRVRAVLPQQPPKWAAEKPLPSELLLPAPQLAAQAQAWPTRPVRHWRSSTVRPWGGPRTAQQWLQASTGAERLGQALAFQEPASAARQQRQRSRQRRYGPSAGPQPATAASDLAAHRPSSGAGTTAPSQPRRPAQPGLAVQRLPRSSPTLWWSAPARQRPRSVGEIDHEPAAPSQLRRDPVRLQPRQGPGEDQLR